MEQMVLTYIKLENGHLKKNMFNLIELANEIAGQNDMKSAVLIIGDCKDIFHEFHGCGVDRIYYIDDIRFDHYNVNLYGPALSYVFKKIGASILIATTGSSENELLPWVAADIRVPMISNVCGVEYDDHRTLFNTFCFSGKAIMSIAYKKDTQYVISCIASNTKARILHGEGLPEIESILIPELKPKGFTLETIENDCENNDISDASIVISGGRGMKDRCGFDLLRKLAAKYEGAVGATRGAVDEDMAEQYMQVGKTGKVISPDLYFACGISGASQHLAGILSSKTIIAVNNDKSAPIFSNANYGVVGDATEIIKSMIELTEKRD